MAFWTKSFNCRIKKFMLSYHTQYSKFTIASIIGEKQRDKIYTSKNWPASTPQPAWVACTFPRILSCFHKYQCLSEGRPMLCKYLHFNKYCSFCLFSLTRTFCLPRAPGILSIFSFSLDTGAFASWLLSFFFSSHVFSAPCLWGNLHSNYLSHLCTLSLSGLHSLRKCTDLNPGREGMDEACLLIYSHVPMHAQPLSLPLTASHSLAALPKKLSQLPKQENWW